MRIHQFVHTLNYGDAISAEALTLKRLLREVEVDSEIYRIYAHEHVKHDCRHAEYFTRDLEEANAAGEETAVILHYSIASPLNDLWAGTEGIHRVAIYHNLTPPEFYRSYNARVYQDLIKGREEIVKLFARADIVVADSPYNRRELEQLGLANVGLVPVPLDYKKWSVPANQGIASVFKGHGGTNVLHVGRIAPNKCIEDLLKAFYFYHHKINRDSRLWIVGSDVDNEMYSYELRRLVLELKLRQAVTFVGTVADSELRAMYENSQLYVCMSEHEGFCVPLVEAMSFKVPVIAYDCCAIKDTLGGAGLLTSRKSPSELAELMHIAVSDSELREKLIAAGSQRAASFGEEPFSKALLEHVVQPLQGLSQQQQRSSAAC